MNLELLREHIARYRAKLAKNLQKSEEDLAERRQRSEFYRGWTAKRLEQMTTDDLFEYLSKLWAMRIWGNKQYVVDKLIASYGIEGVRAALINLIWTETPM